MKIKDVSNPMFNLIQEDIEPYNFKLVIRKGIFNRKSVDLIQRLELFFHKEKLGIKVKPIISVSVKPIEQIFYKAASVYPEEEFYVCCIYNNMLKLYEFMETGREIDTDDLRYYLVKNDEDVKSAAKSIGSRFIEYILPYLDNCKTISDIDTLLNSCPDKISIHHFLYPQRACLAIIAAKLNSNPNYQKLVTIYEKELEHAVDRYRLIFKELKIMLNEIKT